MSFDQATIKHITGLLDIDGAPYPPSITPVVLPLNHIPTGTGTFPPLQDSGIIISHPTATQTAIDFLPSVPNTVVVGYDSNTNLLTVYNSVGGALSINFRGVIAQAAPTAAFKAFSDTNITLSETTDHHMFFMDSTGVNVNAGNNLPIQLSNVGGQINMTTGGGIDTVAATGKPATMHSDTSVELHETTDNHQLLMNSTAVCLAANNGKPLHLTSGAGQDITLNTGVTVSPGAVLYAYVTITPTLDLAGATATITNTVAAGGASYPLVFPSAQGAASSVLVNDGAGNLSWQVITIP
jgi:hypothetical protein